MPDSGTNWVAISAIIATPVTTAIGGYIGFVFGGRRDQAADQRRFDYERRARAADDLIVLLDEIALALDVLRASCTDLQNATGHPDGFELQMLDPLFQAALSHYHAASAQIARMNLRPRANGEAISLAQDAAEAFRSGIRKVGAMILTEMLGEDIGMDELEGVNRQISDSLRVGVNKTRAFEAGARATVETLLRSEIG